jgi:hypothetical protein
MAEVTTSVMEKSTPMNVTMVTKGIGAAGRTELRRGGGSESSGSVGA